MSMKNTARLIFAIIIFLVMWILMFEQVVKADYAVIQTPCPQIFCVKTTPYWKHQSWRVWIEQTEALRPNRYYVQRSVWSVALR